MTGNNAIGLAQVASCMGGRKEEDGESVERRVEIRVLGRDREAIEGLFQYLKRNLHTVWRSEIYPNTRDPGFRCYIHVILEGESAEVIRRSRD